MNQYLGLFMGIFIVVGTIVKYFTLSRDIKPLKDIILISIPVSFLVLFPIDNEVNYDLGKQLEFIPWAYLTSIIFGILLISWKKLISPISELTMIINVVCLFLIAENFDINNVAIQIIITILFFCSLYYIISKNNTPAIIQFGGVFINAIILCIVGYYYTKNILDLGLSALYNELTIPIGFHLFFFGFNILWILQQVCLLLILFPKKNQQYSKTIKHAWVEYRQHINNKQVNTAYGLIFIIILSLFVISSRVFGLLTDMQIVSILLILSSVLDNEIISKRLFQNET